MKKHNVVLIVIGIILVLGALGWTLYNEYESRQAGLEAMQILEELESTPPLYEPTDRKSGVLATPDYILNPEMGMPTITVDGYDYIGRVSIPVLNLDLPVMDQLDYTRLKVSPCLWIGSVYTKDCIIAAHNYSTHFGTLNGLRSGDDVVFTDNDHNVFNYKVIRMETIDTYDTETMVSGDDWDLTLFTCTVGGASRVTVRCKLVEN